MNRRDSQICGKLIDALRITLHMKQKTALRTQLHMTRHMMLPLLLVLFLFGGCSFFLPDSGGAPGTSSTAGPSGASANSPGGTISPVSATSPESTTSPEIITGCPINASGHPTPPPAESGTGGTAFMQHLPASIDSMTLEQKIGQMMFPAFRTNAAGLPMLQADESTLASVTAWQPGGIVLFAQNMDTPDQTAALIRQLQGAASIPLLVGVDEEGGKVSRLSAAKNMQAVTMPAARTIGATGDPKYAREAAAAIGSQLSHLGFNLDFAPDADVDTNPNNPVIGSRSYGREPQLVADMVTAALEGFADTSVIPVVKHFPGHGDTQTDSHLGLAVVPHDRERIDRIELVPFKAAIAAGVPVIMTAHVNTPGISDKDLPATLNPDILTGLLREELGFKGVITTDAMEMGAITEHYGEAESIVMAVEAGVDLLLVPVSLERACEALLEAVRSGRVPEARIDASVERILAMKRTYRLDAMTAQPGASMPGRIPGTDAYRELVKRIEAAAADSK